MVFSVRFLAQASTVVQLAGSCAGRWHREQNAVPHTHVIFRCTHTHTGETKVRTSPLRAQATTHCYDAGGWGRTFGNRRVAVRHGRGKIR